MTVLTSLPTILDINPDQVTPSPPDISPYLFCPVHPFPSISEYLSRSDLLLY
ncbi:uncharacterized protein BDW47DRAFT_106988 [Aspergillus candidus]|uniref:Uncharacterized protein n=1 Tax=Aspergillus candidus TaxID=41067 RepID=A0A2I2F9V1_ASPCN|nr:hypothetical protein BDW47DRAFT_106988 [Aspergillus candidus]PLB37406.1 hypothetical protein BDW47DRAFT_106988 [Aspergillus candidus]